MLAANLNSRVEVLTTVKLPFIVVIPPPALTAPPGSLVKLIVRFPKVVPDGAVVLELLMIKVLAASNASVPCKIDEPYAVVLLCTYVPPASIWNVSPEAIVTALLAVSVPPFSIWRTWLFPDMDQVAEVVIL